MSVVVLLTYQVFVFSLRQDELRRLILLYLFKISLLDRREECLNRDALPLMM